VPVLKSVRPEGRKRMIYQLHKRQNLQIMEYLTHLMGEIVYHNLGSRIGSQITVCNSFMNIKNWRFFGFHYLSRDKYEFQPLKCDTNDAKSVNF